MYTSVCTQKRVDGYIILLSYIAAVFSSLLLTGLMTCVNANVEARQHISRETAQCSNTYSNITCDVVRHKSALTTRQLLLQQLLALLLLVLTLQLRASLIDTSKVAIVRCASVNTTVATMAMLTICRAGLYLRCVLLHPPIR